MKPSADIQNRFDEGALIGAKVEYKRKEPLCQVEFDENKSPTQAAAAAAKKPKMERVGDWVCLECNNLNFGFRDFCNRCDMDRIDVGKTIMSQHELETL